VSRRFLVRRQAEKEINRAFTWYEKQRVGLGGEFLAEIRKTMGDIAGRPESFPIYLRRARRALVHRFPYKIFFVVDPNRVSVVAVLHGRQSERRLRGRL
jgi:plasmid stabilization system protein ParE